MIHCKLILQKPICLREIFSKNLLCMLHDLRSFSTSGYYLQQYLIKQQMVAFVCLRFNNHFIKSCLELLLKFNGSQNKMCYQAF